MLETMHKDNPRRNLTRRLEREIRHNNRAEEERSKTVTRFENIKKIDVYFYGNGGLDNPHKEIIVYFTLKEPVLIKHFEEMIKEKLKEVTIK